MSFGVLKFGEKCDRHPVAKNRGMDTRAVIFSDVTNKPPPPVMTGRRPVGPETPPLSSTAPLQPSTGLEATGAPPAGSFMKQPQTTSGVIDRTNIPLAATATIPASAKGSTAAQRPSSTGGRRLLQTPGAGEGIFQGAATSTSGASLGTSSGLTKIPSEEIAVLQQRQQEKEKNQASSAPSSRLQQLQERRQNTPSQSRVSTPASQTGASAARPRTVKQAPGLKVNLKRKTPEEEAKAFARVDFNGNGMLSLAELDKAVIELWPQFNNKPAIMRAYKAADANGSGFVSRKEFRLFMLFIQVFDTAWNVFSQIDTNGDRRLTKDEFLLGRPAMKQFGIDLSVEEMDATFDKVDKNHGGFVLFDEFCAVFAAEAVKREKVGFKATKARPDLLHKKHVPKFLALPSKADTMSIFHRLDFNGNGMLSLAELDKAIVELWPQFNNKPAIMRAYKASDSNKSGFISKKEFRSFLQYLVVYQNLWDKFDAIDTSDDRRVSEDELLAGAKYVGPPLSGMHRDELIQVFRSIDKNGGGYILFDEFCSYFAAQAMQLYKSQPHDDDPAEIACVGLPTFCHLCGHQFSHEMFDGHYKRCLETFQAAVNELPTYLRFPVPAMSDRFATLPPTTATPPGLHPLPTKDKRTTPQILDEFNAEAKHLFLTETKRKCPECHGSFTTHALMVHFGAKHLKTLSTSREKELRKKHSEVMKEHRRRSVSPKRGGGNRNATGGAVEISEPSRLGVALIQLMLNAGGSSAKSGKSGSNEEDPEGKNIPVKNLRRALDCERSICPEIDRRRFTQVLFSCRLDSLIPALQLGKTFTKERPTVLVDAIMAQFPSTTIPSPKKKYEDPTAIALAPTALPPPEVRKRMISDLEAMGENKKAALQAVSSGKSSSVVSSGVGKAGGTGMTAAQKEAAIKKAAGIVVVHCVAKFLGGSVEKIQIEDPTGTMKTDRVSMLRRLRCAGYQDIQSLESIHVV